MHDVDGLFERSIEEERDDKNTGNRQHEYQQLGREQIGPTENRTVGNISDLGKGSAQQALNAVAALLNRRRRNNGSSHGSGYVSTHRHGNWLQRCRRELIFLWWPRETAVF